MSGDSALLTKEIRKAMIDADVSYDQIGEGSGSTWYKRIRNAGRMSVEDYFYLCRRLHIDPDEPIRNITRR